MFLMFFTVIYEVDLAYRPLKKHFGAGDAELFLSNYEIIDEFKLLLALLEQFHRTPRPHSYSLCGRKSRS